MLLVAALCHLTLLGLSLWVYPPAAHVDSLDHQDALFRGQFRAAVRGVLDSQFRSGEQVIIVGSSNALLGFRPDELEALMPGRRVHNVSTGSLRMDEIRQLVQLAWSVMRESQRAYTTFVVPLVFSSFPAPQSFYSSRATGIADEIRRTGAFREVDGEFIPRWTRLPLTLVLLLERPLAFADACRDNLARLAFGVQTFVSDAFLRHVVDPSTLTRTRPRERLLFPRSDTVDGHAINLAFFRGVMGGATATLGDAQFEELRRLCRWAGANGVHLVLVGMPIPQWVRTELPFFAEYQRRIAPILDEIARTRTIRFVGLYDAPVPMWDATHPDPAQTRAWAEALADALRPESGDAARAGAAPLR